MLEWKRFIFVLGLLGLCFLPGLAAAQNTPAVPFVPPRPVPALAFDSELKEYDAKPFELSAPFVFTLSNNWTNEILIRSVKTSCGCTVASLPSEPWHLAPGSNGQVQATVNLSGKPTGTIEKTLTFDTSVGPRVATVRVVIPQPPPAGPLPPPLTETERKNAMILAGADAKAIFKGQCAECHAKPTFGRGGADLYAAACGICHDSPHRASIVTDLHTLKQPGGYEYWKRMIRNGKPNTMMPGFAESQGGPLNDAQVASLAIYLEDTFGHLGQAATTTNSASTSPGQKP
jgi:mono/diheme cytochrome c family protein